MADNTKIEWADATVNAINGCSLASPGCTNCYAMRLAGTRMKHHPSRAGLTQDSKAGPVWTGEVRLNEKALLEPLGWKRPRRIFWNAHGDPFHDAVPDEWIDRVFAVAALTPQHTHMILTKRSRRMRAWFAADQDRRKGIRAAYDSMGYSEVWLPEWPLPNVWLGVSVEDQARADERIPDLLTTPAAIRFISAEPLLGPVDIGPWIPTCYECGGSCGLRLPGIPKVERCTECGEECGPDTEPVFSDGCPKCCGELEPVCPDCGHYMVYQHPDTPNIDWVIVGGESGPGARPMHPDWARSLRDQCAAAGVAFHFKQWGEWKPFGGWVDGVSHYADASGSYSADKIHRFADRCYAARVGKKAAGRLLDGVEHNGMPA